ncbi:MAG TPA: di-heme oxidoredictase family protein, partial [Burkholderiales bacterium]
MKNFSSWLRPVPALIACALVSWLAGADQEMLDAVRFTAGPFTSAEIGEQAFSIPYVGLDKEQARQFAEGHAQFNEQWVLAPARGVWGLGPTFNEDRCAHCHVNNGRAVAPDEGLEAERGILVRFSIPGKTSQGGPVPHPSYGDQLQNRGIEGRVPEEGHAILHYQKKAVTFGDGEVRDLRVPSVELQGLRFGEIGPGTMLSVRVAQQVVGLGLLEAVPESMILAIAKEQ